MFVLLRGYKYKETMEEIEKHINESLKDKEVLSSIIGQLVTKELIFEKVKLLTIDALDTYENKLKEAMNLQYTPISNHINAFDQATGEKFFDYEFKSEEAISVNELLNITFEYFLRNTKDEDPYCFTLSEIFEDFSERMNSEENLKLIKSDVVKGICDTIDETIAYAETMVEALSEDKITMDEFNKRLQFRMAGVYSINIWRKNENN